jgi:4-amino-4-deoxy-L-arabinose transferase-like glycosyltransferase
MKKKSFILLLLLSIFLLAIYLRFRHWPDFLPFDYEKARDLIASLNIFLNRRMTLLGPVSEVEGIFHGPLYYYLVGFCYFLFQGDPRAGSIVSFGFNLASVLALFLIGQKLWSRRVGLIAAFFAAISFEVISYAYWLSNPGPSVLFIFLMFFFFYRSILENQKYLIPALFCFGVIIQFQILNCLFIFPLIVLYFFLGKPRLRIKNWLTALGIFLLPIASFLVFDLRHQFLMTQTFLHRYFLGNQIASSFRFHLFDYFDRLAQETAYLFFPPQKLVGWFLLLTILFFLVKNLKKDCRFRLLLVWIFATLPVFFINSRIGQSSAAFMGVSGGLILALAALLDRLLPQNRSWLAIPFLVLSFAGNFYALDHYLTDPGRRLFDSYEGLFLKRDLTVINWVYQETGNQAFQVDTVTSPLYISPLWDYLFSWYGPKKHLPLPQRQGAHLHFLIIEPFVDTHFKNEAIKKKSPLGKLLKSESFGDVVVQEWQMP